jgi:hypothetical protein
MESLAEDLKAFKLERDEMKSTLLDLRCRSMKNNLVFTGLRETAGEETEAKFRTVFFISSNSPTDFVTLVSIVFNLSSSLVVNWKQRIASYERFRKKVWKV